MSENPSLGSPHAWPNTSQKPQREEAGALQVDFQLTNSIRLARFGEGVEQEGGGGGCARKWIVD